MKNNQKKKIYLAGPLFSQAELQFNQGLKELLSRFFDVYLPQEDGQLLVNLLKDGVPLGAAKKSIFSHDMAALENSDILLILLDGRTVDEGAVFELGVAFSMGKKCVGFQTDPRRLLPSGNNPMIDCALGRLIHSHEDLIGWAKDEHATGTKRDAEHSQ